MLAASMIVRGQLVASLGEDVEAREVPRPGYPSVLFYGHPGRITDPTPQHIIVDWVGIEDTPFSWANGESVESIGGPCLSLEPLTADEYVVRKERIMRGQRPTG